MYVTSKEMLLKAQKEHYAVGAFNIENMEMAQAAVWAAEELKAPIILQTTPGTLKYAPTELFCGMVKAIAENASVPVALHLDHGNSFDLVERALASGYSSVMIDGSLLPFEKNIDLTRRAVEAAAAFRVPVEAELGKLGGKEDDLNVEEDAHTDPGEAEDFVRRTHVDALAVAIGTAHGFYKGIPKLNKALLREIRERISVPLVLHGASGISDEDIRETIGLGICKVNFATELRVAYIAGVKQGFEDAPDLYDPKKIGIPARMRVKDLVQAKIITCGAEGKAL